MNKEQNIIIYNTSDGKKYSATFYFLEPFCGSIFRNSRIKNKKHDYIYSNS
jgi:hypothetical protein